jgi:membrane-associated protein
VTGFVVAGHLFGNLPIVKRYFQLVILAIVFLSILPGIIEYLRHRKSGSLSAKAEESEHEAA